MAALKSSDTSVALDAALVLTSIARRSDSGLLLRSVHADIVALLDRKDTRFGGAAMLIIESETPAPKDLVPSLFQFVLDDSHPSELKPSVVHGLVKLDSASPQTVQAIIHLLSAPLDRTTLISTLNVAGGLKGVQHDTLIALISKSISDPDLAVRTATVQTLSRMGRGAVH